MSLRLCKYIQELSKQASIWEQKDINNNVEKSFWGRHQGRIICATPAIIIFYLLKNGFPQDFVAYASSVLSIIIGLFSTAIIFSFDKFWAKKNLDNASSTEKTIDTQSYNYTKQFIFITGYSIILCIIVLGLLSFSSLFSSPMDIVIWDYYFDMSNLNMEKVKNFFLVLFVVSQRIIVLYLILRIMYNILFVISSLVKFMSLRMNR